MSPSLFETILKQLAYNEAIKQSEADIPLEEKAKQAAKDIASMTPILGDAITAKEAYDYFQNNQPLMGGLLTGAAILPYSGPVVKGALTKGKQFMESPIMESPKNLINQVASNMPTTIKGFYSGTPVYSFARDALMEVKSAINTRTSATSRAFQETWGIPFRKVQDILGTNSAPAVRELRLAKNEADVLRETGFPELAEKRIQEGKVLARKTGEDSAFTAMSIEAQQGKGIIPVSRRGALSNSVYGTEYWDRAIPQTDTARLGNQIGNAHRINEDNIPNKVTNRFVKHLVDGPHVKQNSNELYEYQVKGLDTSRTAGIKESEGFRKGSMLVRAFNKGDSEDTITSFDSYIKAVRGSKGGTDLSPEESIEFLQLAATLNKDNVNTLNSALRAFNPKAKPMDARQMLDVLAKARHYERTGSRKMSQKQKDIVRAFDSQLKLKNITMSQVTDDAGRAVGNADFSKIKKPEGNVFAQSWFLSSQKELGGVNQAMVMDITNKTNYSMISDGHDIFGEAPLGGHHLITAQPITKRKWGETGFKVQHKPVVNKQKIQEAVRQTGKRLNVEVPKKLLDGNYKDVKAYRRAAKKWTDELMANDSGVKVSQQHQDAASASKRKLNIAKTGTGLMATTAAAGMLTNNEE